MASSTQSVVSDGTLAVLDISIDYLEREEISVFFDAVLTTLGDEWDWVGVNDRQIVFTPAVPLGVAVLVKRTTSISKLRHEFSGGAAFTPQSLDEDLKQVLHIAQEASEANFSGDFFVEIDMHNNKIVNLAPGTLPSDAATLGQLEDFEAQAAASAAAAAQSAIDAADASRLVIGTVTTSAPGSNATVEIVGPAGDQALNFVLPRGATGPGVASGGAAGQVLKKVNSDNFNTVWGVLVKADVGLSNVDNTSDANKPISTAQAAGLVAKVNGDAGAARIPSGTTAQQPPSPTFGDMRGNTEASSMEWYNGTDWIPVGSGALGPPNNPFLIVHDNVLTGPVSIPSGQNGGVFGKVILGSGASITIPSGSQFVQVGG